MAAQQGVPGSKTVKASTPVVGDSDQDGLSDEQEYTFGTSPYLRDSDGDGWDDALELALDHSPVNPTDFPDGTQNLGVGLVAHGRANATHIEMVLYSADGSLDDKFIAMSMLTPTGFVGLNTERVFSISEVFDYQPIGGGLLRTVRIPMSPAMVQVPEVVHWVVAVAEPTTGQFSTAATCRLEGDLATNNVFWSRTGSTLPPSNVNQVLPSGSRIDQPIPPIGAETGANPPGVPGQVCVQVTEQVGTGSGSTVIKEVISADCQDGWAAFCEPGACAGSVGSTFETVNPRNLLGG
ncbi:MAG: hypothetical protein R3F33_00870 [Planctomycetota bacterium]